MNGIEKNTMELNIEKLKEAKRFLSENGITRDDKVSYFRMCELLEIYQRRETDRIRTELEEIPLNGITQYRLLRKIKLILK